MFFICGRGSLVQDLCRLHAKDDKTPIVSLLTNCRDTGHVDQRLATHILNMSDETCTAVPTMG